MILFQIQRLYLICHAHRACTPQIELFKRVKLAFNCNANIYISTFTKVGLNIFDDNQWNSRNSDWLNELWRPKINDIPIIVHFTRHITHTHTDKRNCILQIPQTARKKRRKFWNSIHPPSKLAVLLNEQAKQCKVSMVTWSVAVHKPCSSYFAFLLLIHSIFSSSLSASYTIFLSLRVCTY